jgi:hypothetical protein
MVLGWCRRRAAAGHARLVFPNRTMFAKPVDVSDAPQRVAARRWQGKLATPPPDRTRQSNASNGMQHRACKVVHTRPLPTTHNSHSCRSAHFHALLVATAPCFGRKICLGECSGVRTRSCYRIRASYEHPCEATVCGHLYRCRRVGIVPCARGMTPALCVLLRAGRLLW